MLRLRRHLRRGRRSRILPHGTRPYSGPRQSWRRSHRRIRYVVPHASRRPDPPRETTPARHACCRNSRESEPLMTGHAEKSAAFVADEDRTHWHDQSLWFVRTKRDRQASGIPEWEALREAASAIKTHTLSRLADYLEEFERNATANGIQVHWARDAAEHNAIVHQILASHGVTHLVKSKSMLTEECHLNPYLEARGIEVTDTDLGERIVQLRKEPPSHIVMPAIHLKREEIGEL